MPYTIGEINGNLFVNCILENAMVKTPAGPVPVQELREGDFVLSHLGTAVRITATSCDTITWSDNQTNENAIVFKVPAGELGAKEDAFVSYWHRILHRGEWRTAASLGLAKATKEECCAPGENVYRLYNLAVEDPEENGFVIAGGCAVESWSGKAPRAVNLFKNRHTVGQPLAV